MSKTIVYDYLQSISSIVNALVQMCQINSKTTNIPPSCACLPSSMLPIPYHKDWKHLPFIFVEQSCVVFSTLSSLLFLKRFLPYQDCCGACTIPFFIQPTPQSSATCFLWLPVKFKILIILIQYSFIQQIFIEIMSKSCNTLCQIKVTWTMPT